MTTITEEQALDRLRAKLTWARKQKDLAEEFGVSAGFMSAVLNGQKAMTEPMLAAVGVVKITTLETTD